MKKLNLYMRFIAVVGVFTLMTFPTHGNILERLSGLASGVMGQETAQLQEDADLEGALDHEAAYQQSPQLQANVPPSYPLPADGQMNTTYQQLPQLQINAPAGNQIKDGLYSDPSRAGFPPQLPPAYPQSAPGPVRPLLPDASNVKVIFENTGVNDFGSSSQNARLVPGKMKSTWVPLGGPVSRSPFAPPEMPGSSDIVGNEMMAMSPETGQETIYVEANIGVPFHELVDFWEKFAYKYGFNMDKLRSPAMNNQQKLDIIIHDLLKIFGYPIMGLKPGTRLLQTADTGEGDLDWEVPLLVYVPKTDLIQVNQEDQDGNEAVTSPIAHRAQFMPRANSGERPQDFWAPPRKGLDTEGVSPRTKRILERLRGRHLEFNIQDRQDAKHWAVIIQGYSEGQAPNAFVTRRDARGVVINKGYTDQQLVGVGEALLIYLNPEDKPGQQGDNTNYQTEQWEDQWSDYIADFIRAAEQGRIRSDTNSLRPAPGSPTSQQQLAAGTMGGPKPYRVSVPQRVGG